MAYPIILNNTVHSVSETELPCLITYCEKVGGSNFSVSFVADLFLQGKKILFLTAYPMAKDNFLEQVKGNEANIAYITDSGQLDQNVQGIILESGNEELFLQAIKKLPDINERIVLIKNMEVFSQAIFDACLNLEKIIFSGNIDTCVAKEQLKNKQFNTTIIFSKPTIDLKIELPILEKYVGYWCGKNETGFTRVEMN